VGQALQRALDARDLPYEVVKRRVVDYTSIDVLTMYLRDRQPDFVINAAGYTGKPNVDACELNKPACLMGNASLPGVIGRACEHADIPWGHVSSGCIYTGYKSNNEGYREEDPPNFTFRQNNCSFYSGCKALGEEVLADYDNCYVWRLRIPFNNVDSPRNYISKMMRYDRLLDAANSLSQLQEFANACVDSWLYDLPYGVYNLTNPGSVTTREVVDMIRRRRLTDKHFRFFESEREFMEVAAKTPRSNCILDSSKAIDAGLKLTPVVEALDQAMHSWSN